MLKNVKVGTSVTLANGLSATVTRIESGRGWGAKTQYFIKANNGKNAERVYNEAGKSLSGESKYAVKKVTSGFNEAKAKELMGYTADELEAIAADLRAAKTAAVDGSEPKAIDFGDGRGPVMAARHFNGDGTYGGYVSEDAFVEETVRVARGSTVFGDVTITGTGRIINNSKVSINIDFDNMEDDTIDGVTLTLRPLKAVA